MAVTVVLVVTFLTGVLVGRGVRAERNEAAQAETVIDTPDTPQQNSAPPAATEDPRSAPPPSPAEEEGDAKAPKVADEQPPEAAPRTPAPTGPAAEKPPVVAANAPAKPAAPAPAKTEPVKPAAAAAPATAAPGTGYAVQVAAVNARGEADAIVRRLSGKSYAAYVETPKGNNSVFRVRVGPFKTRREAQTVAERLKKEEKFKPWVTR